MSKTPLDVIGYIDDPLIEKADAYTAKKTVRWPKALAIAACLCLVAGSVTALTATGWGTKLIDSFTGRRQGGSDFTESGYDLSAAVDRVPTGALSKEVRDIAAVIKRQFQDQKPFDNWYPGEWQREFASRDEACAFLGLQQIKTPAGDWKEQATTLTVSGNEQGEILRVDLETDIAASGVRMQFFTQVYTENHDEEIVMGARTTEDVTFTESRFTAKGNKQCRVITSSAMQSGYLGLDGFMVEDGILYNLHIAYLEKDANRANDLLHQWADAF